MGDAAPALLLLTPELNLALLELFPGPAVEALAAPLAAQREIQEVC